MSKQLWVPKRSEWTTYTSTEDGNLDECGYIGGFGMASTGKWEHPIMMVYAFTPDNKCIGEVMLVTGKALEYGDDEPANPIHPDEVSTVSMSYDPESASECETMEELMTFANEYQGGEADSIDIIRNPPDWYVPKPMLYRGEFDCILDDHDTAIAWVVSKAQEWADSQE